MQGRRLIVVLLFLVAAATSINCGAAGCPYCGSWTLFSGNPYHRLGQLEVTETLITLPHCTPVKYQVVRTEVETTSFIEADGKWHHPTRTYVKFSEPNNCGVDRAALNAPFARLRLDPQVPGSRYQLELSLTNEAREPDGGANKAIAQWWFIPKGYDPCQSTGGHGLWVCAKLEKERIEDQLESSVKRLGSTPNVGKELVDSHKDWLVERRKACRTAGSGSEPAWAMMEVESCELLKTRERLAALTALDKCIAQHAQDCSALRLPLTTRSRPTR